MQALESVLANVSLFDALRADEIGRVARRFAIETMAAGEERAFEARLVVVVAGSVDLEVAAGADSLSATLEPGDPLRDLAPAPGPGRPVKGRAAGGAPIAGSD